MENKNSKKGVLKFLKAIKIFSIFGSVVCFIGALTSKDSELFLASLTYVFLFFLFFFLEKSKKKKLAEHQEIYVEQEEIYEYTYEDVDTTENERYCPYCETLLYEDVQSCPNCGANLFKLS